MKPGAAELRRVRGSRRATQALLLIVVFAQRLAIPLGSNQLSVTLFLFLCAVVWSLSTGSVRFDLPALVTFLGVCSLFATEIIISVIRRQDPSLFSFLLFIAIYACGCVRLEAYENASIEVEVLFVRLMSVAAGLSISQFVFQALGGQYVDLLARLVPGRFLITGFNTTNPIRYGSTIYRSNGIIFLEPSVLSFFLGTAVVVVLHRRMSGWLLLLLVAGIVPTLAGNGLVIMAVGVVTLILVERSPRLYVLVGPVAAALALAIFTPFGRVFLARTHELGQSNSSSSFRFTDPYRDLVPRSFDSLTNSILGHGSGSAQRFIEQRFPTSAIVAALVPKVLYEYGIIGMAALSYLLWTFFRRRGQLVPIVPGLIVSYALLNPGFLQPTFALAAILFGVMIRPPQRKIFSHSRSVRVAHRELQ